MGTAGSRKAGALFSFGLVRTTGVKRQARSRHNGYHRTYGLALVLTCMFVLVKTSASREFHETRGHRGVGGTETRLSQWSQGETRSLAHPHHVLAEQLVAAHVRTPPRRALMQTDNTQVSVSTEQQLREAIENEDVVTIAVTQNITLSGTSLPPVLTEKHIAGACGVTQSDRCTLDAAFRSRFLVIGVGGAMTLRNVVLKNGSAQSGDPPISDGGALFVFGRLNATRVSFESNTATADGTSCGGAISVQGGSVLLEECAFINNAASDDGGGIFVRSGTCEVRRSSFEKCTAGGLGGGIAGDAGTVTVRYCTFDDQTRARELTSTDVYAGATGAAYLQPFAVYGDYFDETTGDLLLDDFGAPISGPPEGYAYKAAGAGLVTSAVFEPPPPGQGMAPPPPAPLSDETTSNVTLTDATGTTSVCAESLPLASIAGAVAAVLVFLWLLGRFFAREHHTTRPSESTLKHMANADNALLELRLVEDAAFAGAARDAANARKFKTNSGGVEGRVGNTRQLRTVEGTAEDGYDEQGVRFDEVDVRVDASEDTEKGTDTGKSVASGKRISLDGDRDVLHGDAKESEVESATSSYPPEESFSAEFNRSTSRVGRTVARSRASRSRKLNLSDHVGGVFDETETNGAFVSGGEDDDDVLNQDELEIGPPETRRARDSANRDALYDRAAVPSEEDLDHPHVENRSRAHAGRGFGDQPFTRRDRQRDDWSETLAENDGVFDATSERVTAETAFVKARWVGAAAAARAAGRFNSARGPLARRDAEPNQPQPSPRQPPPHQPPPSIASFANASSAARAMLSARGVGNSNSRRPGPTPIARAGSTEALRARIEAARARARAEESERGN